MPQAGSSAGPALPTEHGIPVGPAPDDRPSKGHLRGTARARGGG
jgi:hypothetical protein